MDDDIIEAYDEEGFDYDNTQDEFGDFEPYNPLNDLQVSYQQQQHLNVIDPVYGTNMEGMGNYAKIMQLQNISREKLYIREFRFEIINQFSNDQIADTYVPAVEDYIPRYWTKNAQYLAMAIYLLHFNPRLTKDILIRFIRTKEVRHPVDFLRYCYMVNKYLGLGAIEFE